MPRVWLVVLVAVLILVGFGLMVAGLERDSFWLDEGWTAWIIRDEMRQPETPRETLRYIRDSLISTFERTKDDVHPPLYFVMLDSWSFLGGDSQFALRLPSALLGTLSLAGIYAVGVIWFNRRVALLALMLLSTSGFVIYYARDARMYTLLLALITVATAAYSRLWHKPTWWHGILYSGFMTLALYTHYVSILILVAHLLHLILTWHKKAFPRVRMLAPFVLTVLCFSVWIPIAYAQLQANPDGVLANYLPTNWHTVQQIIALLTGGYLINFILPFVLSRIVPDAISDKPTYQAVLLLLIWLLLPIVILLAINWRGFAIFQMRYIIVAVPAWALIVAVAIDHIQFKPLPNSEHVQLITQLFLAGALIYTQVATFDNLWPAKPRWREATVQAASARLALEPAVLLIAPHNPIAYYDNFYPVTDGITIDIGWQRFTPDEITNITTYVTESETAWAILTMQDPQSWDALATLSAQHSVSYRDSVQGTILYRFDTTSDSDLAFQFGTDNLIVPVMWDYQTFAAGDTICPADYMQLRTAYTVEVSLVQNYDTIISTATNDCMTIPDADGSLHLRLSIIDKNGSRLPLIESGQYWGDNLVIGAVIR